MGNVDLSLTSNRGYRPGRSYLIRALWLIVEAVTLQNPILTPYRPKAWILRAFGAHIGRNVVIKPNVHVKYPWRLIIGDDCWIGEHAWIDNIETVTIHDDVAISQGAYFCTGNHDWSDPGMGLVPSPIVVEPGAWIGAFARIGPGLTVGREAVVTLGAVLLRDAEPRGVYCGNPAKKVRERVIREKPGP